MLSHRAILLAAVVAMADDLSFLDAKHPVWTANKAAWEREERRLEGGDDVLSELAKWEGEDPAHYKMRQAQAYFPSYGAIHATTLAGHIQAVAPEPKWGALGDVRPRDDIKRGTESLAEQVKYNADGIGNDGLQWQAMNNGTQVRALATGHRWGFVEMPAPPARGFRGAGGSPTNADVQNGHRPYVVEWSPLSVPYWEYTHGRLDCLIARVPVLSTGKKRWESGEGDDGFYLFTRSGFGGFGDEFASGGWWMYDAEKTLVKNGNWSKTIGQIPIAPFFGLTSRGTLARPAISRGALMEINQLAVAAMNRLSEWGFDLSDAAKSIKIILGANKEGWGLLVEQLAQGSYLIPAVASQDKDAKFPPLVPQVYDSSSGAVTSEAFVRLLDYYKAAAQEVMLRQVSAPDSSGESKRAGFGEATSPLLATLAARRESYENAMLYFLELRGMGRSDGAFVTYPREFELAPMLTKIDRTLKRITDATLNSPTLQAQLQKRAAIEDGVWPSDEKEAKEAEDELLASAQAKHGAARASTFQTLINTGATIEFAGAQAGYNEAEVAELKKALESDPPPVEGDPEDKKQKPPEES